MSTIPADVFPPELLEMRTHHDLDVGLERTRRDVTRFFREMDAPVFFAKPEQGWSPEQNARHLIKSAWAVRVGLRMPRFTFLLFGKAPLRREPTDMLGRYLEILAGGYQAGVGFRPGSGTVAPAADDQASVRREHILKRFSLEYDIIRQSLARWREADVDRYRMPHPAIGLISVRDMLAFTALHPYHHMSRVRARLG